MPAEALHGPTVADWVEHEEALEGRRELLAGRLVVVQGGSDRHDTVVTPCTTAWPHRSGSPGAACTRTAAAS